MRALKIVLWILFVIVGFYMAGHSTDYMVGDTATRPGYGIDEGQNGKVTAAEYIAPAFTGTLDSAWLWPYTAGAVSKIYFKAIFHSQNKTRLATSTDSVKIQPSTTYGAPSHFHFAGGVTVTSGVRYWLSLIGTDSNGTDNYSYMTQADTISLADSVYLFATDGSSMTSGLQYGTLEGGGYHPIRAAFFYHSGAGSAPSVPVPATPTSSSTDQSNSLTLTWNASSTGSPTSYSVMVCSDTAGTTKVSTDSTAQAGLSWAVSPALTASTKYFWKVNAHNANGWSGWSPTWSFTTAAATPSAPTLSSPADAANPVASPYSLTWNAATGATSYTLQVSTSATLTGGAGTGFVTTTPYNANVGNVVTANPTGLSGSTLYYWHVSATNGNGTSAYSTAVRSFTTGAGGLRVMFKH